ncbi:MAG TPA: hypothetical protein VNI01_07515, partial [Elusimicrobiota bacterium]|nr:hypothetical protein [Elusimicrobiota bacterium]
PQQDEVLLGESYTFRVSAPETARVEVSLDGGPWLECRASVGFWWYDWACAAGKHALTARTIDAAGEEAVSAPRRFQVGHDTTFPATAKAAPKARKAPAAAKVGSLKKPAAKKKTPKA